MPTPPTDAELFTHIRIIIGMVLGLSVARLISGIMRFIQHPGREPILPAHLLWVGFVLLFIVHFWWFESALVHHAGWSFALYMFLLVYAGLFAALASILFPDSTAEFRGLADYFRQRRRAFYVLLLMLLAVDVVDTLLKGPGYYTHLYGWYYPLRQAVLVIGTLVALRWRDERYQTGFAIFALAFQAIWIASLFRFEV